MLLSSAISFERSNCGSKCKLVIVFLVEALRVRLMSCIVQVVWGKMSMVEAERRLLANALQDPNNQHFILLSDR